MGFLRTSERLLERWATNVRGYLLPTKPKPGEVVAILLRQCDDNALLFGRQHIGVPNAFVIELPPDIHRQLSDNPLPVAPVLVHQVCRHAAEQGYSPTRSPSTYAPLQVTRPPGSASTAASARREDDPSPRRSSIVADCAPPLRPGWAGSCRAENADLLHSAQLLPGSASGRAATTASANAVAQSATSTVPSGARRLNALGAAPSKPSPQHGHRPFLQPAGLRATACIPGC